MQIGELGVYQAFLARCYIVGGYMAVPYHLPNCLKTMGMMHLKMKDCWWNKNCVLVQCIVICDGRK